MKSRKISNGFLFIVFIISFTVIFGACYYKITSESTTTTTKEPFQTDGTPQIIVSMTTSPKRIINIQPLLECISNQTIKPDKIVLNLPYVFKRTNMKFDNIPGFVENNPLVQINRCDDIGPSTKILPTGVLFNDPNTIIISVDDDIEYRSNFIETLLKYSTKYPEAVITGESFMRVTPPDDALDKTATYADLVEGYSAVLYKKKFLDTININDITNYPKYCYMADDFLLSNLLKKQGIPIIVANEPSENKTTVNIYLDYGSQEDALKNGADGTSKDNIDNYKKCSNYLKKNDDLYIHNNFLEI
jgi:hypothetical protein